VSELTPEKDPIGLTRPDIHDKIRVHQEFSSESEIFDFIRRESLKSKDKYQGWRDGVSKAFRNIKTEKQWRWIKNIVLSYEARRYRPDPADKKFINGLKRRV
jgi:hypothetical protein